MAAHIALLGDSIFDNGRYTGGAPDVVAHLRGILPAPWRATLCAIDGSTTVDLVKQFRTIPPDASNLVISIGGNDAILNREILGLPVRSTAEALSLFGERIARFESSYRSAVDDALALDRPTSICTIYNGNLDAAESSVARVALMMFNDVILRYAIDRRLAVIDLRLVCQEPGDYANPIEPSGSGGKKIAEVIARAVAGANVPHARVYAG